VSWRANTHMESPRLHRIEIFDADAPVPIQSMLRSLKEDQIFRAFFAETLAASPFSAFRWEMPALTQQSVLRPCEFVLHDAPRLPQRPDPAAFAGRFRAASGELAIAFSNLGGDATLVVPTPQAGNDAYAHFAIFLRRAPAAQRDALLALVGEQALLKVSKQPFWLSTAGMGVAWLHVRLDSAPKYFGYQPYTHV